MEVRTVLAFLIACSSFAGAASPANAAELFVSEPGKDVNDGRLLATAYCPEIRLPFVTGCTGVKFWNVFESDSEFVAHYHRQRPHQGLDNKIITPEFDKPMTEGEMRCRSRRGGLLNDYHRKAA